jgi:hypothetical protein
MGDSSTFAPTVRDCLQRIFRLRFDPAMGSRLEEEKRLPPPPVPREFAQMKQFIEHDADSLVVSSPPLPWRCAAELGGAGDPWQSTVDHVRE